MVGTTLGHYRIDREIGSGGMGVVYAAEDLRLHRQVAVKVVSGQLASDTEFRHRFEREAQAIAALNHPNIVTIHSVEHVGDVHFLTMELVDGKPLSQLIPSGGLPLDRLLKLAVPLADAISAAHQRGITHRDLKPANVMVTDDGRLKVLDFGLAKLREGIDTSSATTLGAPTITGEGRILGTVAYMSPEQAEGRPIDHRSDIFSFGIVLYEMAAGERPFKGGTSVSIISSIIKDTPRPLTDVHASIPRDLVRIVRRCLMKDPEQRYQSAKDIRNDLQELAQALESGEIVTTTPVPASGTAKTRSVALSVIGAVVVVAIVAAVQFWPRGGEPSAPMPQATFTQLTTGRGIEEFPSLSPDGKWFVYSGNASSNSDIYLHSVGGQNAINLTKDTPESDFHPAFSPDGEQIAFRSDRNGGGIFVMGRTGESVRRLTAGGFNPAWSPAGDEIAYATENVQSAPGQRGLKSTLWVVKVSTGEKRQIPVEDAVQPSWSPNGHRIAFWAARGAQRQRDIVTIPASGGEAVLVTDDAALDWSPIWSPDGKHLYFCSERGGSMNVWRVSVDERTGKVLGDAEPVTTPSRFAGHITVTKNRFAYTAIDIERNIVSLDFNPTTEKVIGTPQFVTSGSKLWSSVDVSLDAQWLALTSGNPREDLYVMRADGTGLRQLTDDVALDRFPAWSPDGKQIAFYSNRGGSWEAWTIHPDGSGLRAITDKAGAHYPLWSSDGSRVAYSQIVDPRHVLIVDSRLPAGQQKPEQLPNPPDSEWIAYDWSPDGKWLAGCRTRGTDASGVIAYSVDSRTFTPLSDVGCAYPRWLSDSRRVLFTEGFRTLKIVDRTLPRVRDLFTTAEGTIAMAGISNGDRRIVLLYGTRQADIWMATFK